VALTATAAAEGKASVLVADSVALNHSARLQMDFPCRTIAPDFAKAYELLNDLKKSRQKIDSIAVVNENRFGTSVAPPSLARQDAGITVAAAIPTRQLDRVSARCSSRTREADAVIFIATPAAGCSFQNDEDLDTCRRSSSATMRVFSDPTFHSECWRPRQGQSPQRWDSGKPGRPFIINEMSRESAAIRDTSARWDAGFCVSPRRSSRGFDRADKNPSCVKGLIEIDQLMIGYAA